MDEPFFFDPDRLRGIAEANREAFAAAEPFPHVVIDGIVPDDVLDRVVAEAPDPAEERAWVVTQDVNSVKRGLNRDWYLGPTTRQVLTQCNSGAFLDFLEVLTGIPGLIVDPHFQGGGLHTIEPGGYLRVHADFNRHPRLGLDRRLNVLLYLNRDWDDAWGGHLELWDPTLSHRVLQVAPEFNRLVVFATSSTSFHGHPNPLRTPPGVYRRSLALYYYSNGRPEEERTDPHLTLWQAGVGEEEPRPSEEELAARSATQD